jgi:hypothetical protein
MKEFTSTELANAISVNSSITEVTSPSIDKESIKNDLRLIVLLKDKTLLNVYDRSCLGRSNTNSGVSNLKTILSLLKEFMLTKHKDDNAKNLTLRKMFDTMESSLDCLLINGVDCPTAEINTLLLAFLSKNFI